MDQPRSRSVSTDRIRAEFRRRQFDRMIAEGILAAEVKTDRLLRAASGFPIGTRTQIIRWMDNTGKVVLVTHRYVDAEGKPLTDHDPKFLLVDEEEWHVSG